MGESGKRIWRNRDDFITIGTYTDVIVRIKQYLKYGSSTRGPRDT